MSCEFVDAKKRWSLLTKEAFAKVSKGRVPQKEIAAHLGYAKRDTTPDTQPDTQKNTRINAHFYGI